MSFDERVIRTSQAVTSFGVGAIYDILGESFVLCDTTQWDLSKYRGKGRELQAVRLINNLKGRGYPVDHLHRPVEMDEAKPNYNTPPTRGLPYQRFPRWLFCSTCRRMKWWSFDDERGMGRAGRRPTCPSCGGKRHRLTPMRFIVICAYGHMGDIQWGRWAHSGARRDDQKSCRSREHLHFKSRAGRGGGLDSLVVECKACGSFRSLEGLTAPNALRTAGITCPGKQPWQAGSAAVKCDRRTHAVQRGAGKVYYPSVASAITIPPESDPDAPEHEDYRTLVLNHSELHYVKGADVNQTMLDAFVPRIAEDAGCTEEQVLQVLEEDETAEDAALERGESISAEEWEALIKPHTPDRPGAKFINEALRLVREGEKAPPAVRALDELLGRVMAVRKLREVRALLGFYRHTPGGGEDEEAHNRIVRPDLQKGGRWLPAVEVFGEGIFLSLDEEKLQAWEGREDVTERAVLLESRRKESLYSPILHKATPRFILLHTLAHLLIRRLAFSCGYSSASLRERIYAELPESGEPRAGVLIYTAAGDAEGTLGGLVRQAESPHMAANLISAFYDGLQCSSDPVCRESSGQGLEAMNLASCHACSLIAETSCTSMNLLLDRTLVVGDEATRGYFQTPVDLAVETAAS